MARNLAALCCALALVGAAHGDDERSIKSGGRERAYIVHRPAELERARAAPLVIVLHGGFGTGSDAEKAYGWDALADRSGFVVAYPDGVRWSWNAGGSCCGLAEVKRVDDIGFLTDLIGKLSRDENIDPRRVYLAGVSNGAAMAYRYACEGTFAVAAIGAVSGSLSAPCAAARKLSVIEVHGMVDQVIPFAGGRSQRAAKEVDWLGVAATLAAFREANTCEAPTVQTNGVVETSTASCAAGREVVLVTIQDAGHQWPGGKPIKGGLLSGLIDRDPPSTALDATATLWDFFAKHPAD